MAPEIKKLADKFLMNPKVINVAPPASTSDKVTQGLLTLKPGGQYVGQDGKKKLKRDALRKLITHEDVRDAIVFCNRKIDVSIVYKSLTKHGLSVGQLHGDMSQPARTETLKGFKNKDFAILVCSDVAARGLDIPNLSHVFNYDVPNHAEDYVHRIGRTGRAGNEGHAYTLALPEDGKYIEAIEKLIASSIPTLSLEGFEAGALSDEAPARGGRGGGRNGGRNGADKNRGGGRDRNNSNAKPKPEQKPEQKVEQKAEVKVEAKVEAKAEVKVEAKVEQKTEQPKRQPQKQQPRTAKNNHRNDHDDRSRDIHNQVCDGHMPAFLTNPPAPTAKPKAEVNEKEKAPAKKRVRRKPAAKKAAPEAAVEVASEATPEAKVETPKAED